MTKYQNIIKKKIIDENEQIARKAFDNGDYILCFLLMHSLMASLLRMFLRKTEKMNFNDLIKAYTEFLKKENQKKLTFVNELTNFNRRRNRVVHNLWKYGYSVTNQKLEPACKEAFLLFGLFIEWLETFNPEITKVGFKFE